MFSQTRMSLTRLGSPSYLLRGGHGPHLSEPGGYLFGRKPGQKVEKEGWEAAWKYGFWGSFAVLAVGLYYKPDTRIRTTALKEAQQRMESREDTLDYPRTAYRA